VSEETTIPALEVAVEIRGEPFAEVAGWVGHRPTAAVLSVEGVLQHSMDVTLYEQVHDETDYNVGIRIRRKTSRGWAEQIDAEGKHRRDR
jgi:hypothetical protein